MAPLPAAAPADAPAGEPTALSRRDIIMIVAAIVGSGVITVGLLATRGPAAAAAPASVTASSVRTSPVPPGRAAHWVDNRTGWIGADRRGRRKGFAFELEARNETQVWMKKVRPLLVVRCTDRRMEAFVFTDSAAAMESQDEDHSVRIALDDGAERTERWPDSTAHDALFAPDGTAFVEELSRAKTLRFGYAPHNASPVVAHFDVAGLQGRIAAAQPACGGK